MNVTRRNFVAAAAASTAIAAAGTGVACADETAADAVIPQWGVEPLQVEWLGEAPEIAESEIVETRTTDLLIVGAGNAGMVAASLAAEAGADIILAEKCGLLGTTRSWWGVCNSTQCKEAGLEADPLFMLNDLTRYAGGRCDQSVVRVWIDHSSEMNDWLVGVMDNFGYDVYFEPNTGYGMGAGGCDFYCAPVQHNFVARQDCPEEFAKIKRNEILEKYINGLGYQIDYDYDLVKLVREGDGPVTGAIFKTKAGYVQVNARAVLLTTGGYPGNYEMLEALNPQLVRCTTSTAAWTSNTGMGIKAAMWAGAQRDLVGTGYIWDRGLTEPGTPCGFVADEENGGWKFPHMGQFNPGSQPFLRVNAEGERFMNESGPYDWSSSASSLQTNGTWNTVWDADFCEDVVRFNMLGCAASTIAMRDMYFQEGGKFDQMAEEGTLVKADTLEELAEGLHLPVETFLATVERYNELAEAGYDEDFGKETYRLSTLKNPPFYGITVGGCILSTGDGLRINNKMQVKDRANKVIEGLYAAGDCAGSFFGGSYPELYPGVAAGHTMTEAYMATKYILGL